MFGKRFSSLNLYILVISTVGLALNICSLWQVVPVLGTAIFWLLVGLAIAAVGATTSAKISSETGITYHIVPAISLVAASRFGLFSGVLISSIAFLLVWLAKPRSGTWKKSLRQLAFNAGSDSITIFVASCTLIWLQLQLDDWGGPATLGPWFLAAFAHDLINSVLLVGVLRLQHGPSFGAFQAWKEMQWSSRLSLLVNSLGGWILAYAITNYDWRGILVFFLPILLSAYAFRLYIEKVRSYMDNLEEIVEERTAELAQRTEELAQMNRQKDTFLTVLTHDMITPLTSIRMCTEMLDEQAADIPKIAPISTLIMRNQRVLINLAHNIMDIEKLQAGVPIYLEKEPIDVGALICDTVELMRPEAKAKAIALNYDCREERLTISADQQQMQRILLNLISNAIKYTPEDGVAWVRANTVEDQFILEVEDTGYGIAPDELPNIFERFMRASQMRGKVTGTGIGLAVVKSLVEAHDGQIEVTSNVNEGTKFTVTMPVGMCR